MTEEAAHGIVDIGRRFGVQRISLYAIVSVVVALITCGALLSVSYAHRQAKLQADAATHNLANSLVLTFDGWIGTIDVALVAAATEMTRQLEAGEPDGNSINKYLLNLRLQVPNIVSLRATNENGDIIYGLEADAPVANAIDRDYFVVSKSGSDARLYISKPIISRINSQWVWLFSRRITKRDGTFGGVVTASILAEDIEKLLRDISMPPGSSISLRHQTRELVARVSYGRPNVIPIGDARLSEPFAQALAKNQWEGTYISDATSVDKVVKIYSYETSRKYGFNVNVAIPMDEAIADWRKQMLATIALIIAFIGGAIVFLRVIRNAWNKQESDLITIEKNREALQYSRDALKLLNFELEDHVSARTAELSAALEHLRKFQNDLIESEKLASLGAMVAGVSHEINTPIGNAVTLTSVLVENVKQLDDTLHGGAMSRSSLQKWIDEAAEIAKVLDRSVNRVAELVRSFKQVAIDQSSERRREFDLRETIDNVIASLRPNLREYSCVIQNKVPQGIHCDSYPGPLGQIIANLIQNAALHAFDGRNEGNIILTAIEEDKKVELSVVDDGVGMDSATLAKIYDPFFTTKLGKGGSGLGLAISHRIVTNVLNGEIHAVSSLGEGSRFSVTFPKVAPGKI